MRIAVHAKVLSEMQYTGIGVYTHNLLKALAGLNPGHEYVLYSNESILHPVPGGNVSERILNFPAFWSYLRLPFEFMGPKYDLLFVPKEFVPPLIRPATVVSCFDLMHLRFSAHLPFSVRAHFWVATRYALKAADRILAISEATKRDVVEHCGIDPAKVVVTPLGYDRELYRPCEDGERIRRTKAQYGIRGPYFINTSSVLWRRKNLVNVVRAFALCRERGLEHQLLITGKKGESQEEILRLVDERGLKGEVVLTGFVPEKELPVLLSGAETLVFPSLHEGFGLPLLEAMACGCPVITSNVSAMPEVVGEAGVQVDPDEVEEIAAAMEKIASDEQWRRRLREKGFERAREFSWEKTARQTLDVFESVGG